MEPYTFIGDSDGVTLTSDERRQHLGIFGATGAGKSTLLRRLAAQDITRGDGLLLIDPHGNLAEDVLRHVPAWRHNHVAYFHPGDLEWPIGLNVLEDVHPDHRAATVDAVVAAMHAIWPDSWGPRLEIILRHSATALIELPNASLAMLPRLLTDDAYRQRVVARVQSPLTRAFFEQRFESWRDTFRGEAIEPVLNKVEAFLAFPAIRNIVGQARSTLHLTHAIQNSRIVIANLGKGALGESASRLMGALLLAQLQTAAMSLGVDAGRRDFHAIIDEAQSFGTDAIAALLSEARKFGISLTLATQYLAGLTEATRAALLGNVGTLIVYRVGSDDAAALAPQFHRLHSEFNPQALRELARGEVIVRTPSRDTTRIEIPHLPLPEGNAETIKRQSRRHYGVSRLLVEKRLERALGLG